MCWIIVSVLTLTLVLPARAVEGPQLRGHVPVAVAEFKLQPVGDLPAATRLNLTIGLPLRNQEALDALLHQISDPTSPNFRHYPAPEQFADRFGPTEKD